MSIVQRLTTLSVLSYTSLLVVILFASGCPQNPNPQMVIDSPANGSSVTCSGMATSCTVNVVTRWTGISLGNPTMTLDGTSVPNAIQSNGTGTLTTALGTHTIVTFVSVNINNGVSNLSATSTFTVVPPTPTLILSPSNGVSVQTGSTTTFKVTTDMPLSSPLTVALTSGNASIAKLGASPGTASTSVTLPTSSTSMPGSVQATLDGISAGSTTISATATGALSTNASKLAVTVTAGPPPPAKVNVFRSGSGDVQSFALSSTNAWSLLDTQSATPSPGNFVVGLALTAAGQLLRTSASDVQIFTIGSTSTLALASTTAAATLSGTGASIATSGTMVVRGSNSGIQTFTLSGSTLTAAGIGNGGLASTGVGVDTTGTRAVRATSTGIEVFTLGSGAVPTSFGSNMSGAQTSTNPAVRIFAGGTRAVRAHDSGIEIYDITLTNVPRTGFAPGGPSASGTAVALNSTGTLAVRAFSGGIEVYTIAPTGNPVKVAASTNVALSSTGVGACVKGTTAIRATDSILEAFDITSAATGNIMALAQTTATMSATGVGLTCR